MIIDSLFGSGVVRVQDNSVHRVQFILSSNGKLYGA